jgi:hypothetical protein
MAPKKKLAFNKKSKGKEKPETKPNRTPTTSSSQPIPTFHRAEKQLNLQSGIHAQYKQATQEFRDGLQQVLPQNFELRRVPDLQRAANFILDSCIDNLNKFDVTNPPIVVSDATMLSLKTSLALRQEISNRMSAEQQDEGHTFMIDTLRFCRKVLLIAWNLAREIKKRVVNNDVVAQDLSERFNAFASLSDPESDEDDDEDEIEVSVLQDFPLLLESGNFRVEAPLEPENASQYTIEQLVNGDDRFQAVSFLSSMEIMMQSVYTHYEFMKSYLRGKKDISHSSSTNLYMLMECSVVANIAMESVEQTFATLTLDHPHIKSFYDLLAIVFAVEGTLEFDALIPSAMRLKKPNLAKSFVGKLVELAFRNRGWDQLEFVTQTFAREATVNFEVVEPIATSLLEMFRAEVQLTKEELRNKSQFDMIYNMTGVRIPSNTWFRNSPFLGNGRSILNTHVLLQRVFDVSDFKSKLSPLPGWFGPLWHETKSPARQIRGDMDQYLAGDLLPELVELCKHFPFKSIPHRKELIPLLDMLYCHLQNSKDAPIPIALSFGFHLILTANLALQGDGDIARLAIGAKASYNKLFAQLDEQAASKYPMAPSFISNINLFRVLKCMGDPIGPPSTNTSELNAFWNPVMGGSFLLFGTYLCSIGLGSVTIDAYGQLRFVLHLYNALRKRSMVEELQFLESLQKTFARSKAIWVGGCPNQGSFVKQFWLAWGMSHAEATRRSELKNCDAPQGLPRVEIRKMDAILPEQFSASYRLLVMRDFSGEDADCSITHVSAKRKGFLRRTSVFFNAITRINMARDSMDKDEMDLLPVNLPHVGGILNEFCEDLSKELGWDGLLQIMVQTCPAEVRNSTTHGGNRKQSGFHRSDENLRRQALAHFWSGIILSELDHCSVCDAKVAQKAAAFMTLRFGSMSVDRYTFIVY